MKNENTILSKSKYYLDCLDYMDELNTGAVLERSKQAERSERYTDWTKKEWPCGQGRFSPKKFADIGHGLPFAGKGLYSKAPVSCPDSRTAGTTRTTRAEPTQKPVNKSWSSPLWLCKPGKSDKIIGLCKTEKIASLAAKVRGRSNG